jgi:hypothetical protein
VQEMPTMFITGREPINFRSVIEVQVQYGEDLFFFSKQKERLKPSVPSVMRV